MPIRYSKDAEHIVLITIDRPQTRNALDKEHFHQLASAWAEFRDDQDAWVGIITGVGRSFMAGADLRTFIPEVTDRARSAALGDAGSGSHGDDGYSLADAPKAVLRDVDLYKPVIAAINGPCVAGGMEMLGGIDIRIATKHASFGVLEPARGLFAGGGTTARLPRQIPFPHAMELLLTAERFGADEALRMGLINKVVGEEALLDEAYAFARRITKNAPLAIQATKESVVRGLKTDLAGAYEIEGQLAKRVFASADARLGPRAFLERRQPEWQGR